MALERVKENNAGVVNHHIKWSHIKEALFDPVTWLYVTMIFTAITPNGVFGTFGSIIIKSLGFNTLQSLGIQVPSGFIGFLSEIVPMYIIRRTNNYRFHLITLFEIIVIIGGILLWAAPRSNTAALLAGYCNTPLPMSKPVTNFRLDVDVCRNVLFGIGHDGKQYRWTYQEINHVRPDCSRIQSWKYHGTASLCVIASTWICWRVHGYHNLHCIRCYCVPSHQIDFDQEEQETSGRVWGSDFG